MAGETTSGVLPFCFVVMPFGTKNDPTGRPPIDFDRIYTEAIEPAIRDSGMNPVRADRELVGGIIHKPMFERLLLCEFAVADLTTANANVFYELGVRHATRPRTTLPIFSKHQPVPFDVNLVRALPYELGPQNEFTADHARALREALKARLGELRQLSTGSEAVDSPLFQLLQDYRPGDVARLKTDVFRERVQYAESLKSRLAKARKAGNQPEGLRTIEKELGDLASVETGVLIDLFLSYRAVKSFSEMVRFAQALPPEVQRTVLVREQLAFALNRLAGSKEGTKEERESWREEAIRILQELEDERGANSETCGLLGRIYKDRWEQTLEAGETLEARSWLDQAIETYTRGFEADWRDAYPGINACTLLDVRGDPESLAQRDRLLPVVRFAVEQRLRGRSPDYWDHATMLELAVLAGEQPRAQKHLGSTLAAIREKWEPETTARNLGLILKARKERGADVSWLEPIIQALAARTK